MPFPGFHCDSLITYHLTIIRLPDCLVCLFFVGVSEHYYFYYSCYFLGVRHSRSYVGAGALFLHINVPSNSNGIEGERLGCQ